MISYSYPHMHRHIMKGEARETISLVWEEKDREGFINDIKSIEVQRNKN